MLLEFSIRNSGRLRYFKQFRSAKISTMVIETRHLKAGDAEPIFPDDGKLQLLSMRFCPYAQRTHIILEAKNIPYHTFNINLNAKPEWLTKYSPNGKVPALGLSNEVGKPFIHESMVIADYLDEKYPDKQLYPKDPLSRAVDRLLIERFNNVSTAYYKAVIRGDDQAIIEIQKGLDEFEAELKKRGTTFFGGVEPGMLDYMIWPWCERISAMKYMEGNCKFEIDSERYTKLVEWNAKMIVDPAVNVHYIQGDVHFKFLEGFKTKKPDYDMLL